jgi:acyl-CoA synthetase (NDP forming)
MPVATSNNIRSFFEPKSVAVAGVSTDPGKMASIIFANLRENADKGLLRANVYALNPAHRRIGRVRCYPSVISLPEVPDLLIIAVPVSLTLQIVKEAAESGVKAAVIVTSGFAEAGRKDLEAELIKAAASSGMRILGPNTIGLLDTRSGVDSLFLRPTKSLPGGREVVSLHKPRRGGVAVITQSGHLGEVISEELAANRVGIRSLVGTGNQADVSVEDLLGYFADDDHTRVIAVYLEGVLDGRRFMRESAKASGKKPVVVLKVGKTGAGAKAALTHTASMAGDYQAYQAAFRQSGLVEVPEIEGLVDACVALSMLPPMPGKRMVILTNAGGVGAIAADEAQRLGLEVVSMSKGAVAKIRAEFSHSTFISNASLSNPIDLTASASTDEFVEMTGSLLSLNDYDMALLLPTHQTPAMDYDISTRLSQVILKSGKPVSVCVIGRSALATRLHRDFLRRGVPSFPTPERAVRALSAVVSYATLRRNASPPAEVRKADIFHGISLKRGQLDQPTIRGLLRAYGIAQPRSVVVGSVQDLRRARGVRFPVACKLLSSGLIHKTDAGAVLLDIPNKSRLASGFSGLKALSAKKKMPFEGVLVQEMVKGGIEMIVGAARNPAFGPTVLFGFGGTYTELTRDYSMAIAPVSPREARRMIAKTRLSAILEGYRGGPKVDLTDLSELISRFSRIMVENPSIEQIEINPLIATAHRLYAVDTRAFVAPAAVVTS